MVNGRQLRFRTRGLADMQGAAISTLKGRGDALLHGQDLPQTAPATLDVVFLQLPANDLYELISQYQQFRAFRKKQLGFLRVLFGVQNALSLFYQELL